MPVASGTARTRFGMGGWGVRRAGSFSGKDAAAVVTDDSPYRARTPDSNVYRHHASDELMNYRDRTLDNDTYRPTA